MNPTCQCSDAVRREVGWYSNHDVLLCRSCHLPIQIAPAPPVDRTPEGKLDKITKFIEAEGIRDFAVLFQDPDSHSMVANCSSKPWAYGAMQFYAQDLMNITLDTGAQDDD